MNSDKLSRILALAGTFVLASYVVPAVMFHATMVMFDGQTFFSYPPWLSPIDIWIWVTELLPQLLAGALIAVIWWGRALSSFAVAVLFGCACAIVRATRTTTHLSSTAELSVFVWTYGVYVAMPLACCFGAFVCLKFRARVTRG
jgi:hypothetical protein